MKIKHVIRMAMLLGLVSGSLMAQPMGTAFTYQARLVQEGYPANGTFDFRFALYDAVQEGTQIGPAITRTAVVVSNGLFATALDFGPNVFTGPPRWLGIGVRPTGTGDFTLLQPRQPLTPAPYALFAGSAATGTGGLAGSGTAGFLARFADSATLRNSIVQQSGANLGVGGVPTQKLDVWSGDVQVRGPDNFTALGQKATVYLGDANHFVQAVYGGGVKIGAWMGERIEVEHADLLVHGPDNFAGPGSTATVFLGDTVHYLRAKREYGITLGTWPVGDVLAIREPNGYVGIGTANPTSRLTVQGNLTIKSASTGSTVAELGEGLDYAEGFDVTDRAEVAPGTVLVIDAANPGKLTVSTGAYDRKVAGIVAGARGLGSGVRLGVERFDQPVALAGRVYCNVDGNYGAVQPGDLLTTSPTPGHAMVVKDHAKAAGAILGKAMETLTEGTRGQILVLVTLQ